MATTNYKSIDIETLIKTIKSKKYELAKKRMAHAVEPLKNPMEIRKIRRDIARAMTEVNSRKNTTNHDQSDKKVT